MNRVTSIVLERMRTRRLLAMQQQLDSTTTTPPNIQVEAEAIVGDAELPLDQVASLAICGSLSLILYSILAIAILWMTYLHFKHDSSWRKKLFHIVLFVSVSLNLPDPISWIVCPNTERWKATYALRIWSLVLQSICKSYISMCWSEVVSAGQSFERRRMTSYMYLFNGILLLWGVSVPFLVNQHTDDIAGNIAFFESPVRPIMTYSGVVVILIYGILLTYQGMRLRRRLLLAKGTVPAGSVEKSLSQLMLTVYVIMFADTMRIISLILAELKVDMALATFTVLNNLIPNIFPAICMLYLMRRVTNPSAQGKLPVRGGNQATLSRYMNEENLSRSRATSASSDSSQRTNPFALPASQIGRLSRPDQQLIASNRPMQSSPPYRWVRE